jgi:mycofactocin system glycosyltransferase
MRLVLDTRMRSYGGGRVLVAGARIVRLTENGPAALRALLDGVATPAEHRLGERLVAAGLAHPRPCPRQADATTVIPARDRPADLARCLAAAGAPVVVVDDGSGNGGEMAAVCRRHGATLIRRDAAGGPAVARNDGVGHVETALIAFLDSDCVPSAGWIDELAGHFDDPLVAAVAPRVRALGGGRSPLDLGPHPAAVQPGQRVSYVPSAALVVRRAALPHVPFDPALRYGEDVDLVWRLVDAGWRVRYDPRVVVHHEERRTIARRFRYGMSAAPLARRHPGRLVHVVIRPWPAVMLALLLARRPALAALTYAAQTAILARMLRARGVPVRLAPFWTARALLNTITQFGVFASPYGAGVLYGRAMTRTHRGRDARTPAQPGPGSPLPTGCGS